MKRRGNGTFERVERVEWHCLGCGLARMVTPGVFRDRKYCKPCAQKRAIAAMLKTPRAERGEEYRKNLSESLKKKWASGTRKANSIESRQKMSKTLRRRYSEGSLVRPKLSRKVLRQIGRKVSKALKGRVTRRTPNSSQEIEAFKRMVKARPDMKPDERHFRARVWRIRSPENRVFEFKNLAKFIRDHPELFLPEDVIAPVSNKRKKCHAYGGLNSISPRLKRNVGSWKGWTWYSFLEQEINGCRDLLERNVGHDISLVP